MLKAVRLTGSVFMNARFTTPFGVIDPSSYSERTPMAYLRHVSILHLMVAGGCRFETAGEALDVTAGDLLFLPFPGQYRFWGGDPERIIEASEIVRPGPIEGMWTVNHGGGGDEVRMVCGFVESSEFLFAPVFRSLPPLLVERTTEDKVGTLVAATVGEIVSLVEAAEPGTQAVLGRLMELLFVELLRRHIARLPASSRSWFAALNDPVVGRGLQLIHAEPARHWTVEEIASRVGSSRAVLADRFKTLIGHPPIEYLASWRIQLAAERLCVGHESISSIAAGVGYESEAAFHRAFKRITGKTPAGWRQACRPRDGIADRQGR
jgi:AraC-like DNA-binding protein